MAGATGGRWPAGNGAFGNDPDRFLTLHARHRRRARGAAPDFAAGMAPHSLRAVDPAGLQTILGQATSGPVHMHLAEQVAEVDEVQAASRRAARGMAAGQSRGRCPLVPHPLHADDRAETDALAATGAVAGLCPLTESNLGDGIFNGTRFLGRGGVIGFGSDSNVQISLFEELKTLEYAQRLRDRSRAALATQGRSTGRVLFDAAAKGGAQAGGRDSGRIATGAWADLAGYDTDTPQLCDRRGDAALDSLIFAGGGAGALREVWSAGRHVVRQGRHIRRDAIIAEFMRRMRRLETDI